MTRLGSALAPRILAAGLLAIAVMLGVTGAPAAAQPIVPVVAANPALEQVPVTLGSVDSAVGAGAASLTPDTFAIPVDSPYRFTASVRVPKGTDSVQMRFKVLNPSGRLMIQKTHIQSAFEAGEATAVFERETSDLGLSPGSYPVRLEVTVVTDGSVAQEVLETELLVYDAESRPVPVVFAVRISGQPLSDPEGRFVADPSRYTRARDDARALAVWVTGQPEARVTLALSPLLLEEWKRISEGYVLTGPEGEMSVAADTAVPRAYAEALDRIKEAVQTGRLELTLMGYTDPDLDQLADQGLADDVAAQYAQGISAVYASLESTPTTGTIVAGGCVHPETVGQLLDAGVSYAVVDADCARSGSATATPGAYRVKGLPLVALVADRRAGRALNRSDLESMARIVFERRQAGSTAPVVVKAQVGPGELTVGEVTSAAEALAVQPWARTALGAEVAGRRLRRAVALTQRRNQVSAPPGYWDDVRDGRRWATALAAALPDSAISVTAERDSLIAECSAWAGPGSTWAAADRGRGFATHAVRLANDVFGPVDLEATTVTLAGSRGVVPVTISNGTELTLALVLKTEPSRGVRVLKGRSRPIEVLPQDNFVEIPVDIQNALTGQLTVKLVAGDTVIDEQTVNITASYLDRLVMIGGVIVVLGILLAFVIRRVRAAEQEAEEPVRPRD